MSSLKTIGLTLIIASLALTPVYAKRGSWVDTGEHMGSKAGKLERMALVLDLTPDQEAAVKKIVADSKEQTAALLERSAENREEIRNLVDADALDEARLRQLVREQAELRTDMMIARHGTRSEIDKVLTPEQQEKHQELRQQRLAHKGKRHGSRP